MITLSPSYGCMLGGTGVVATGEDLVVSETDDIVCLFDGIGVKGIYINSAEILCVSPMLERTGKIPFKLNISGSNGGESVFDSCKFFNDVFSTLNSHNLSFVNSFRTLKPSNIKIKLGLYKLL